MKSTLILSLVATAIAMPLVHAEVTNRVTLSGSVHSVGAPVVRSTGNSSTSTSTIVNTGITNSSLLDSLVTSGDISDKRGYSIVQVLSDEGTPQGYIAFNSRTGDTVEIPSTLIGNLTGAVGITANTTGSRTTANGTVNSASSQTISTGTAFLLGTSVNAYATGTTKLSSKTFRTNGSVNVVPYTATTTTTDLRGVTADQTVIDATLKSSSSTVSNEL